MALSNRTSRSRILILGIVLGVFLLGGLWVLRSSADGLRNAFSLRYWIERRAGFDLYNPNEHYLKRGSRSYHNLLLTFDDAPHNGSTQALLHSLKDAKVPAAFFVIGRRVKERPDLVREMLSQGDEVGNHTQDHLRLDLLTAPQVKNEIRNCEINVLKATGRKMTLLRPPGMRLNRVINDEISDLGYTVVGWNVGAKDFIPDQQVHDMSVEESTHLTTTPGEIVQRVLSQVKDGDIILLHDNPVTAEAMPELLKELQARGYRFITTAEMLAELPHPITIVSNPAVSSKLVLRG